MRRKPFSGSSTILQLSKGNVIFQHDYDEPMLVVMLEGLGVAFIHPDELVATLRTAYGDRMEKT